jgi:hypothetical protein
MFANISLAFSSVTWGKTGSTDAANTEVPVDKKRQTAKIRLTDFNNNLFIFTLLPFLM